MTSNSITSDKVEKRSVSFSPGSIAIWAEKYGQAQEPKLSFSAVVCASLTEYRQRHDPILDDSTKAALAQVEAAAVKDPTLADDVLQFIRDRKRIKRSPR